MKHKSEHKPLTKLTERRREQKLSLRKLGDKSGIAFYTIYKYEHGITSPTLEMLEKIAAALNCDVKDLI